AEGEGRGQFEQSAPFRGGAQEAERQQLEEEDEPDAREQRQHLGPVEGLAPPSGEKDEERQAEELEDEGGRKPCDRAPPDEEGNEQHRAEPQGPERGSGRRAAQCRVMRSAVNRTSP